MLETNVIVVATDRREKILYIIGNAGVICDRIELHFTDKYTPTVEFLLRVLRKAFGWVETDRDCKDTVNTKCKYSDGGLCKHPNMVGNSDDEFIRCNENMKGSCKSYERKYNHRIRVNTVTIEKLGVIRGLD